MIDFHLSKDMVSDALEISKKSLELFSNNDVLQYNYAKCLLANGFYSECLNELENTVILPNEGEHVTEESPTVRQPLWKAFG